MRAAFAALLGLSLAYAFTGSAVRAGELVLEGDFVQGGLIFGQAAGI